MEVGHLEPSQLPISRASRQCALYELAEVALASVDQAPALLDGQIPGPRRIDVLKRFDFSPGRIARHLFMPEGQVERRPQNAPGSVGTGAPSALGVVAICLPVFLVLTFPCELQSTYGRRHVESHG